MLTQIPGHPNYSIDEAGNVYSNHSKRYLKPTLNPDGYYRFKVEGGKAMKVHRAVALTFLGEPEPNMDVCHRNGNRHDNRLENLYYGSDSDNQRDSLAHGTLAAAKINKEDIEKIHSLYSEGFLQREIAEMYGLCQQNISCILRGKTWL